MLVIVNKAKVKQSQVKHIFPGEVFRSHDGEVYLKTTLIKSGKLSYNAVMLCNGELFCFKDETEVFPLTPNGRISFNEVMIKE